MKVVPHKRRSLGPNEIRVITIGESAIEELLLENLMEHVADYFQVKKSLAETICVMSWSKEEKLLTYAIMPVEKCLSGYDLDCDYLRSHIGVTTDTLFKENCYRSLQLTKEMLRKT